MGLEMYVQKSGIDKRYIDLVKIRTSQINGCATAWTCIPRKRGKPGSRTNGSP